MNIFVGFYLQLGEYENKGSGYEWDHEVASSLGNIVISWVLLKLYSLDYPGM